MVNKTKSDAYPVFRIAVDKYFSSSLATDKRRNFLEFPGRALPFNFHGFVGHLILIQTARVLPSPEHKLSIRLLRLDDLLLDI